MARILESRDGLFVKICGITREQDALDAIGAGADALGFNSYHGSKRYLDIENARGWIGGLRDRTKRILVSVNMPVQDLLRIADRGMFEAYQLHGDESPEECDKLSHHGLTVIKALAVTGHVIEKVKAYPVENFLLDTPAPGEYGGTGRPADRTLAKECVQSFPEKTIILSGGLKPDNVRDAIMTVGPAGVDVASGVEEAPGIKSTRLMRDFVAQARSAA